MRRLGAQLPLVLLGLWASGCGTMHLSWMQPRADGAVELVLEEQHKSPNLHIKGSGGFTMDSERGEQCRVRWRAGAPAQVLGCGKEGDGPYRVGELPQASFPPEACAPPEAPPARLALQREGESTFWCVWPSPEGGPAGRVEGREPGEAAPRVVLVFDGPGELARVVPLSGRRAVVQRGPHLWLVGPEQATPPVLLADQEATVRGVTDEGAVLLMFAGRHSVLLLRAGPQLVQPLTARALVSAAGSLWIDDEHADGLQRIDPTSGQVTRVPTAKGFSRLLGADRAGWLWFNSDLSDGVRPGKKLPVRRWNPATGAQEVIEVPTQ